ncbi:hypothetical protein TraAM80_05230 [Trypanosoma rangeli]|uniref:Uncharacterized protein n=1 Tax=Trypanosoma rangeli TaxID=5698 RepID=A0A3S5IR45_TRYRA|nr:uncharacterized protein TraAM80_05230 [Trypanosoma rangeli]RNF04335.1 hypothetical protein TraAM80_05230 [Trypanosoma rangeli]|eukprot:RNF04335.1 hypothetical protein TraAM80_05230 [Trypanosoma rangeli]
MPEAHGDLVLLPRVLARAFRCLQDVPIMHFVEVIKVNRRGKRQQRFFVITPTHLYSCVENGTIQRCVPTRSVAEVHTWDGELPQVGLKIPSEYDMLFFMKSGADVAGVVAALQSATRDAASGGSDRGEFCLVGATEALSAAAYALERPKWFEQGISRTLDWSVGGVGEVPAVGTSYGVHRPFVSANTEGLFLRAPTAAAAVSSLPPLFVATGGVTSPYRGETPLPGSLQGTRCLSHDYSADDVADAAASFFVSPNSFHVESVEVGVGQRTTEVETRKQTAATSVVSNSHHDYSASGTAAVVAAEQALWEQRRQMQAERELWCLLLAAERRNTYRLRQAISDLRGQVLALSSQNLAMRTELLSQRVT